MLCVMRMKGKRRVKSQIYAVFDNNMRMSICMRLYVCLDAYIYVCMRVYIYLFYIYTKVSKCVVALSGNAGETLLKSLYGLHVTYTPCSTHFLTLRLN